MPSMLAPAQLHRRHRRATAAARILLTLAGAGLGGGGYFRSRLLKSELRHPLFVGLNLFLPLQLIGIKLLRLISHCTRQVSQDEVSKRRFQQTGVSRRET